MLYNKAFRLILSFSLIFAVLTSGVFTALASPWDEGYNTDPDYGRLMPFMPSEGYVSQQNPPAFTWGYVETAESYEIAVALDRELNNIVYAKKGITFNYYNFDITFETGVNYYWAVRYYTNGKPGEWSTVRKFRISLDAYEFTLPEWDVLTERIPKSHPRIWVTKDTIEEFRNFKNLYDGSRESYDAIIALADEYLADGTIAEEPEDKFFDDPVEQSAWNGALKVLCEENLNRGTTCAYAYIISGDEKYVRYALDCILEISGWDINGITSYQREDRIFREFAYRSAMVYDWLYDLMTEEERASILNMVKARTQVMEYLLDSLNVSPYDSHGWTAYGFIGIIALATYGDIPEAELWLEKVVKGYSALLPPWSYQDGGWSQGTYYWEASTQTNHEFMECLALAGVLDLFDTAWAQNEYLWNLYVYPPGSYGAFGDHSNRGMGINYTTNSLYHNAYFTGNPVTAWLAEETGNPVKSEKYTYYLMSSDVEPKIPSNYQLAHEFSDIGWVAMTNNLVSKDRIQFIFKSSPYGSYNHSNADQNSFLIQAYGENLAVKSGYTDTYHSVHDSGFTRKTAAHNSVTVATNKGQLDDSFMAKGKINGFLTQIDYDLVRGDATQAYDGKIGKFQRNVIYVRPDMFVIVDDLKSAGKKESRFEWWLNARHDISLYKEGNGARLQEGEAVLDATVVYPQKVTSYYNNIFAASDMEEFPAGGSYAIRNVDRRVWFETEKTIGTKMIVTLDVHRESEQAQYVQSHYFDDYVKMIFEDGTIILVNLNDSTEEVSTGDGFTFTGEVLVYNDRSIMLVNGTELKQGDKELMCFEKPASVVIGENELGISTYEDNKLSVNVNNDYADSFTKVTDYYGNEINSSHGITYERGKLVCDSDKSEITSSDEYVTFIAGADNYELMLNGKLIEDSLMEGSVSVTVDGVETNVKTAGYMNRNGTASFSGSYDTGGKKFKCVDMSDGLVAGGFAPGKTQVASQIYFSTDKADGNYIALETVKSTAIDMNTEADYDSVKGQCTYFAEAEDYIGSVADGASVYDTRTFLSGGKGVQGFNNTGTVMNYTVTIEEEGDYAYAVKYVAWEENAAARIFNIDGKDYIYTLEKTDSWGTNPAEWKAGIAEDTIHLLPGTYTLTMEPVSGLWNYDWFGFIKK